MWAIPIALQFKNACAVDDSELVLNILDEVEHSDTADADVILSAHCQYGFEHACMNGHLQLAQTFLAKSPSLLQEAEIENKLFPNVCLLGKLNVAQWILSITPEINISKFAEGAFPGAVAEGRLDVAKWLLSVKPDIDITAGAFRIALIHDHVEMAQWIFSVKPDIDVSRAISDYVRNTCCKLKVVELVRIAEENEAVFRYACSQHKLEMVEWFQSQNPFMFQVERYACLGIIRLSPKIRRLEEVRWRGRKYALWMRSSINTTVFYCVPQDVSRYIVQSFL